MPTIQMPRLSDSMEEGVIVRWLVADGDEINVGQEIAEIETDKATMEFEAEDAGTIHLKASEGETVAVGVVIAAVGDAEDLPGPATPAADVSERDAQRSAAPASRPIPFCGRVDGNPPCRDRQGKNRCFACGPADRGRPRN